MAEIKAFKAIIYNKDKVKDLSRVVAPPYDIISPQEQKALYKAHPCNIVRLLLEKDKDYDKVARDYKDWLKDGALVEDSKPSIYVYLQEFKVGSKKLKRLGFLALLKIDGSKDKKILPHENVLSAPLMDRLRLMKKIKSNLSPIFSVFGEEKNEIVKTLESFIRPRKPSVNIDFGGVRHKLWKLDDAAAQKKIAALMKNKKVFIADGHHRHKASTLLRDYMRKRLKKSPQRQSFDYLLSYFVSANDKGLVTLPTHRAILFVPGFNKEKVLKAVSGYFRVSVYSSKDKLLKELQKHSGSYGNFGMYMGGNAYYFLRARDMAAIYRQMRDIPPQRRRLDVVILHNFMLKQLLGLKEGFEDKKNIVYSHDEARILDLVKKGKSPVAFLLNATKISDVKDVAFSNLKMPQKSTYFYPKVLSGLVINQHR